MPKEFFISASWTSSRKVPAKSTYGVALKYGDNAFSSIANALSAGGGADDIYHVYDQTVTLNNDWRGLKNIRSQEIKPTNGHESKGGKETYSAKSQIAAARSLRVTDTHNTVTLDAAGFKNVTIYNKSNHTGVYTVRGGSNTVIHTYTGNDLTAKPSIKDSASISGKADGVLTVSGAHVFTANGAWAESNLRHAVIASDNSAFIPTDPGEAGNTAWGSKIMDSPLKTGLPGYLSASIVSGASADVLVGGSLTYSHVHNETYGTAPNVSVSKNYNYRTLATGVLNVGIAAVGSAYNYAKVNVSTGNFDLLKGGNTSQAASTTYNYTVSSYKLTSENYSSTGAVGTVGISGGILANAGAHIISGYATVSLATGGKFGKIVAGSARTYTKDTEEVTSQSLPAKIKKTVTHIESDFYSAGGVLSSTNKKTGTAVFNNDVVGFKTVNLSGAVFSGAIVGAEYVIPPEPIYPVTSYVYVPCDRFSSETTVSSAGALVQSRLNERFTSAAAGTVTLSAAVASKGIKGYYTVKLTGASAGKFIQAGRGAEETLDSISHPNKNGIELVSSNTYRNSNLAAGSLIMSGGMLFNDAAICDFATVTLNGVQGKANYISALNNSVTYSCNISSGGRIVLHEDIYNTRTSSATGTFTVSNGGGLTIGEIRGFNKITVNGGTVLSGISNGENSRSFDSKVMNYASKSGILKSSYNGAVSRTLAGSVELRNATVAGGIGGYQKVTLSGGVVSGGIGRMSSGGSSQIVPSGGSPAPIGGSSVGSGANVPNIVSGMSSAEYDDSGARLVKTSSGSVISATATMELTLKNGAKVYGDVVGVKKLTASDGTAAVIGGTVDMTDEKELLNNTIVSDYKKVTTTSTYISSSLHSAGGTLTANGLTVGGNIVGAAKVTAVKLKAGDIDGHTTSSYCKSINLLENVNSNCISSAAGSATLSGALVGSLLGFADVTVSGGAIGGADGWTDKEVHSVWVVNKVLNVSYTSTHNVGKSFSAKGGAVVSGGIVGYKSIVLDAKASVNKGINAEQYKSGRVLRDTLVDGGVVGQNLTNESSFSAMGELTLRNGAKVNGDAYGIRIANLTDAELGGELSMSGRYEKETNTLTSNAKTKLFEQNWQSSSWVSGGTLTLKNANIADVYGAAKVTMTDATIEGDVYGCGNKYTSSSIVAKGSKLVDDEWYKETATGVNSKHAVEWTEKFTSGASVSGSFKLTGGGVAGAIENFATVNLLDASVGRLKGGFVTDSFSHVYSNGTDIFNSNHKEGALGTLTAYDVTFTDGDVLAEGFATVVLVGCAVGGGAIWGGTVEGMRRAVGSGANFPEARDNTGSAAVVETYTAAGMVTATDTVGVGDINNCATVTLVGCDVGNIEVWYSGPATLTLAGSNSAENISGYESLTVKNGATSACDCTATAGNDTFVVNAGASLDLHNWSFRTGNDKAVVNGVVRLHGNLENKGKLAFSGPGSVAVTERTYITIKNAIAHGTLGDVTGFEQFVNAGADDDLLSVIRSKKEELADNKASGAVKFTGEAINGWLSGDEDADLGKFADTADWIKFKYDDDCDYFVGRLNYGRDKDVEVEIWQGGNFVDHVKWDGDAFKINGDVLKDGVEYQVAINMNPVVGGDYDPSALKYTFMAVAKA